MIVRIRPFRRAATPEHSPATEQRLIDSKLRSASRALLIEKLWPRFWLLMALVGVFVVVSAFDLWSFLTPVAHRVLLVAFVVAFAIAVARLLFLRRPSVENSIERLQRSSSIAHRPLAAYNDTLSQDHLSPETTALWKAHRARAAQSLWKLTAGSPHPRIDRDDPFALRAALIVILVAVAAWAWTDLGSRMKAALDVPALSPGTGLRIDVWVTPPAYTRKEAFVLPAASASKDAIAVPQGSVLSVKINGAGAAGYNVTLDGGGGMKTLDASSPSSDNYAEFAQKIDQPGTLTVKSRFAVERSWPLGVVMDKPPSISFTGPIEVSQKAVMLFKYKVDDDYGVASAEARVERVIPEKSRSSADASGDAEPQIGKPPVFALSLSHPPVRAAEGKTYKDLTAHPWAGLPVVVTLAAKDEAGHEGLSAPRGLILPERKFTKALARAVIDQRRSLVESPRDTQRPANNLGALAISAEDEGVSPTIYLGLRSAYWRLRGQPSIEDIEGIVDQLWDVAIRIEDGDLSAAERDLRAAQDRLRDALERGASQEELRRLMQELRQALNRFLQAPSRENADGKDRALPPNAKMITPQDLQQLLDKIESLAKAGSAEAAAQMLSQLRDILESLQTGRSGGGSEEGDAESMQQMDKLTDIMRKQQQLLDQTFRNNQQAEDGTQGDSPQQGQRGGQRGQRQGSRRQDQSGGQDTVAGLQRRQGDLRRELQELIEGMGGGKSGDAVRKKLDEAEEAMGEAGESLQQNELGQAGEQEGHALESLRQGTRAMAEQMMRSAQGGRGSGDTGRDPLGRKPDGQIVGPGDNVDVPKQGTVMRAREILEELRKRLGQPSRPPVELDYLERLVKPY